MDKSNSRRLDDDGTGLKDSSRPSHPLGGEAMQREAALCSTYNYGDALYWDSRYLEEGPTSFDWYQRYSALRPFLRMFVPTSARILMAGCGNAAGGGAVQHVQLRDAVYWGSRYLEEGLASFDWYQRYSALRPFLCMFVPTSARILMVGCGNADIFFPPE